MPKQGTFCGLYAQRCMRHSSIIKRKTACFVLSFEEYKRKRKAIKDTPSNEAYVNSPC